MPNQSIATSVANQFKPVPLTCARNSRYPVCALEKDSAGFGDLILPTAQAAIRAVFLRVSFYGRSLWEPFGVAGFPLVPVRQPVSSCPPCLATGRQAFKFTNGGHHA